MIRVFVRWEDGRPTEEDFVTDTEAYSWIRMSPGIASAAICEKFPENPLMDDVDRAAWICVDVVRPSQEIWRSQPEEEPDERPVSKKKRKKG